MQVLSVGDLVFSSDSRVSVSSLSRRWQDVSIWIVKIRRVATMDQGLYQCQVIMARYRLLRIVMWPPWIRGFISAR